MASASTEKTHSTIRKRGREFGPQVFCSSSSSDEDLDPEVVWPDPAELDDAFVLNVDEEDELQQFLLPAL